MTDHDLTTLHAQLRQCTRCQQAGHRVEGPPIFSGNEQARAMIVGQAPGRVEIATNTLRPFSGNAGARLFRWLSDAGWAEADIRRTWYITSITKCFPGAHPSGRGDRAPTRAEQRLCADWLEAEVALIQPALLVPIGSLAIARFLGPDRPLADVVGTRFQVDGRAIIPLPHPSGASGWLQKPAHQALIRNAIAHLAAARIELGV